MIYLHKPYIAKKNNKYRLTFDIEIDKNKKKVWFEVDSEYKKYLCDDRVDAIVVGLLSYAMRGNHDIESDSYITEEIKYKIVNHLMPALSKYDSNLHYININIKTKPTVKSSGAVGTGCSCGVDSIHAYLKHYNFDNKQFKLTHLCINNVGAFNETYEEVGTEKVRKYRIKKAMEFAKEVNLPLIVTDSNFLQEIYQNHLYTHTYSSSFAILCLQKLWAVYYYGSSGYDYSAFNIVNSSMHDCASYELLSLDCFSTNNLKIYSEGGAENRLEKTAFIYKDGLTKKYLHVCVKDKNNCSICSKCMRTLLSLYALNANMNDYNSVFDIKHFKNNINDYFEWILKEHLWDDKSMNEPTYQLLLKKEEFKDYINNYNKNMLEEKTINYKEEYEKIINSKTFKLGDIILKIPRKIKNIVTKRIRMW